MQNRRKMHLSLFLLIIIMMLMTGASLISPAYGKITPKSVWYTVDSRMIRTKDLNGNKFTFVCNGDKYSVYLTLRNNTVSSSRYRTYVSLYINRKTRIKYEAYVTGNALSIDLSNSHDLIRDMRKSFDINAFLEGGRGTDIMSFALDGFDDEFEKICL